MVLIIFMVHIYFVAEKQKKNQHHHKFKRIRWVPIDQRAEEEQLSKRDQQLIKGPVFP